MLNAKQARQMTSCQIDKQTEEQINRIISSYAEYGATSFRLYNSEYKELCESEQIRFSMFITDALVKALIDGGYTVNIFRDNDDEIMFLRISW